MNFLKQMYYKNIEFDTIPIETIYEGRVKNFKLMKDSYRIYKEFLKNMISSILCAVLDVGVFYLLASENISVFNANIIARIISGLFDFAINKKCVFHREKSSNSFFEGCKYTILFIIQMLIGSLLVSILNQYYAKWIVFLKIGINVIMYVINFYIKKKYVFVENKF